MKIFKKFVSVVAVMTVVLTSVLSMGAFKVLAQDNAPIKIGILQFVKHKALDDVVDGFKETIEASDLGERVEWDIQVANGEIASLQSIGEKLARNNDILLAVATPAAQALAAIETTKPIFIAAVTDPVEAGLAKSMEKPETNVTGTSDMAPIDEQVALLTSKFPEAKNVGIIYNSSEVNSKVQAELAQQSLEQAGLTVVTKTVTSTNDVSQSLDALIKEIDVLFMVTDNTIDSSIALVGSKLKEAKIPTVGSSESVVLENALMTLSNSYKDYGVQTADMVVKMVNDGLEPQTMPIELGKDFQIVVNEDFANAIGLDAAALKAK